MDRPRRRRLMKPSFDAPHQLHTEVGHLPLSRSKVDRDPTKRFLMPRNQCPKALASTKRLRICSGKRNSKQRTVSEETDGARWDDDGDDEDETALDEEVDSCCPRCRLDLANEQLQVQVQGNPLRGRTSFQEFDSGTNRQEIRRNTKTNKRLKHELGFAKRRTSLAGSRSEANGPAIQANEERKEDERRSIGGRVEGTDGRSGWRKEEVEEGFELSLKSLGSNLLDNLREAFKDDDNDSATCDTIQKLIEQTQHDSSSNNNNNNNNADSNSNSNSDKSTEISPNLSTLSRRYSLALWRVVGGGSGLAASTNQATIINGRSVDLSSSSNAPQHFQAHRDSISEAAKRLGRRLSLGGTTLLGRLLNATMTTSQEQPQQPHQHQQSERQCAVKCDIKLEDKDIGDVDRMGGPISQSERDAEHGEEQSPRADKRREGESAADNRQRQHQDQIFLMTTDVMSLFRQNHGEEFAQRHRQSIAVQTFFTKSIEMTADEELDVMMRQQGDSNCTNAEQLVGSGGCESVAEVGVQGEPKSGADETFEAREGYHECQAEANHDNLNGENEAKPEEEHEEEEEGELTETSNDDFDDSTTSGWTAPTTSATTTGSLAKPGECDSSGSRGRGELSAAERARMSVRSNAAGAVHSSNAREFNQAAKMDQATTKAMPSQLSGSALICTPNFDPKSNSDLNLNLDLNLDFDLDLKSIQRRRQHKAATDYNAKRCERARSLSQLDGQQSSPNRRSRADTCRDTCSSSGAFRRPPDSQYCWPAPSKQDAMELAHNEWRQATRPHSLAGRFAAAKSGASKQESDNIEDSSRQPSDPSGPETTTTTTNSTSTSLAPMSRPISAEADSSGLSAQPPECHEQLERINSDFSSLALETTATTTTSRSTTNNLSSSKPTTTTTTAPSSSGSASTNNDRDLIGTDAAGQPGAMQMTVAAVASNQRRAFSETEAYTASFSLQLNSFGDADHVIQNRYRVSADHIVGKGPPNQQGLPSSSHLIGGSEVQCNALTDRHRIGPNRLRTMETIDSPLTPSARRLIRSAEPSRYNSAAFAGGSQAATSSSSSSYNQNVRYAQQLQQQQQQHSKLLDNATAGSQAHQQRPLAYHTASTGSATGISTNPTSNNSSANHHHSMTNLIGPGSHYRPLVGYLPLSSEQVVGSERQQQQPAGHQNAAQSSNERANSSNPAQQAASAAKCHKQQWYHSNTFSSSLNSDISTSGGQTKDTTEKDSSRRTSTLSGISSIYQQEISLGLTTPYSHGGSTPANSQAAPSCANMGSIPELAGTLDQNVEALAGGSCASLGPLFSGAALAAQPPVGGPPCSSGAAALELERTLKHMSAAKVPLDYAISSAAAHAINTDSFSQRMTYTLAGNKLAQQQQQKQQQQQQPADFPEQSTTNNLQRVAQSLKSQFRERLATMRSFNSLIGGTLNSAPPNISPVIQKEPADSSEFQAPDWMDQQGNQEPSAPKRNSSDQAQPPAGSDSTHLPASKSGTFQGRGLATPQSKADTPTPAILRSFFRSTSSAAFNAFASSFQYPSSSSTPTTVIPINQTNLSTSSQHQFALGSLSSEVFDPPISRQHSFVSHQEGLNQQQAHRQHNDGETSSNIGSPSPETGAKQAQAEFQFDMPDQLDTSSTFGGTPASSAAAAAAVAATTTTLNQQQTATAAASMTSLRSPLSPISVTSTRFFARIRDKFNLSPLLAVGSGGAAGTSSPTRSASALSNSTSTSLSALTIVSQQHQQAISKPLGTNNAINEAQPLMEQRQREQDGQRADFERASNEQLKWDEPTLKDAANSTIPSSLNQPNCDKLSQSQNKNAPSLDTCHDDNHYEQVVSSRRPSFQRELDEQVNQVYRMAVDRKLQNSPLVFDSKLSSEKLLEKTNEQSIEQIFTSNNLGTNLVSGRCVGGSDLESIIRPMSALVNNTAAPNLSLPSTSQHLPTLSASQSIYMPANYAQMQQDFYLPAGSSYGQPRAAANNYATLDYNKPWLESSQQSIDSSSSARSLRSCWFSMPELYAMHYESSSQSPSDTLSGLLHNREANRQQAELADMEELLGALAGKLQPEQTQSNPNTNWDQQQQQQQQQRRQSEAVAESWPSSRLYKQITSDQGQNWSLSDLNLTSDDIKAPNLEPIATNLAKQAQQHGKETSHARLGSSPGKESGDSDPQAAGAVGAAVAAVATTAANKQMVELIKCSTLDDSVCVSMKSSSSKEENLPTADGQQVEQNSTARKQSQLEDELNRMSRPTSQNSTISSTSCALSDLNSSELRSPTGQQHWTTGSSSPATPLNVSPLSANEPPPGIGGGNCLFNLSGDAQVNYEPAGALCNPLQAPNSASPIPRCLVTDAQVESATDGDALAQPPGERRLADERRVSSGGSKLSGFNLALDVNQINQKQRAMSLLPSFNGPDLVASGSELASSPLPTCIPRAYRSARGSIMPGVDVAPAATTLDLRLPFRRNRVKLSDLHPITFMNDRKFLSSMSSLKKADDNKLNAIFNGPVGRRLSVNAELNSHLGTSKPNIKIGLTGYVYMNNSKKPTDLSVRSNIRRQSLAPNIWLTPRRPSGVLPADSQLAASSPSTNTGNLLNPSDGPMGRLRPRAASCTPSALLLPATLLEEVGGIETETEQQSATQMSLNGKRNTADSLQQDEFDYNRSKGVPNSEQIADAQKRALNLLKPSTGSGGYQIDRRRSTIAMLDRLSEKQESNNAHDKLACGAEQGRSGHRKSVSCLLKIGEEEELQGFSASSSQAMTSNNKVTVSNNSNHLKAETKESGATNDKRDQGLKDEDTDDDSKDLRNRNDSGGDGGGDSSSDDGDLDRLIARYPDHSFPAANHTMPTVVASQTGRRALNTARARHRSHSISQPKSYDNSDKVVKNEMILKQLLQATNAASITSASTVNKSPGGDNDWRRHKRDVRRFSVINLYQRDEDVFVANSMKRPPSSQLQVLNTLPLLAGTLPVINSMCANGLQASHKTQTWDTSSQRGSVNSIGITDHFNKADLSCNQLPVLSANRSGMKSIITGNSGLNAGFNCAARQQQSRQATNPLRLEEASSASASALLVSAPTKPSSILGATSMATAEVDIEEQLNRLRQQEKRSFSCQPYNNSSRDTSDHLVEGRSDTPASSLSQFEQSEKGPLLARVGLDCPNESGQSDRTQDKLNNTSSDTAAVPALPSQLERTTGQSRPLGSPIDPPVSPPLITSAMIPINLANASSPPNSLLIGARSPAADPYLGSKSCEPFKQLDTIMEGRGLLLGAKHQADSSYTHRLRRLSGNYLRRPSMQSNAARAIVDNSDEDWCKCHLLSPSEGKRRHQDDGPQERSSLSTTSDNKSRVVDSSFGELNQQTGTTNTITSSSKFVLDTMKSLARRTLNNLTAIGGSTNMANNKAPPIKTTAPPSTTTAPAINLRQGSATNCRLAGLNKPSSGQAQAGRQQRSSSMIVSSSGYESNWMEGSAVGGEKGQQTLPSRLLREKVRVDRVAKAANRNKRQQQATRGPLLAADNEREELEDVDDCSTCSSSSTTTSSVTGSADDSSLMSLDDAEKYRTQNKDNKMKHGRSLSSSLSCSSSDLSVAELDLDGLTSSRKRPEATGRARLQTVSNSAIKGDDATEAKLKQRAAAGRLGSETTANEDREEDEEDFKAPKVCYKCNKKIRIEGLYLNEGAANDDDDDDNEYDDEHEGEEEEEEEEEDVDVEEEEGRIEEEENGKFVDEEEEQEVQELNTRGDQPSNQLKQHHSLDGGQQNRQTTLARSHRSSQPAAGRSHHGRHRNTAARRSASMNSAEPDIVQNNANAHINRRKNKWHIQRNLAPKLKRQRSFSANYAPEVPNPVMPPPRRFSAAPTLSCPHRNKSSSLSSSSLHHTYSIDSSESMITVIPANRNQELKRTSRGSLSSISNQGGGAEPKGSLYTLPKSPVSPRSPGRCSPGLLTPNTSEPGAFLEPPFSPATTTNTTCSSTGTNTVIQQQTVFGNNISKRIGDANEDFNNNNNTSHSTRQTNQNQQTSGGEPPKSPGFYNLALPANRHSRNLAVSNGGTDDENLSLAVENGTSYNSSRLELDDEFNSEAEEGFQTEADDDVDEMVGEITIQDDIESRANNQLNSNSLNQPTRERYQLDPDRPVICETINDFCARHSREELEYLIRRVGFLEICDCYFSEKSSTLCMVIEVKEK